MAALDVEPPLEPVVDPLERDLLVALVCGCFGYSGPHGLAPQAGHGRGAPKGPQAMLADAQSGDKRGELVLLAQHCAWRKSLVLWTRGSHCWQGPLE